MDCGNAFKDTVKSVLETFANEAMSITGSEFFVQELPRFLSVVDAYEVVIPPTASHHSALRLKFFFSDLLQEAANLVYRLGSAMIGEYPGNEKERLYSLLTYHASELRKQLLS